MRRLNVKLVVILSTVSLISIVLVALLHSFQMKRTAGVLLSQARDARAEDDLEKAASFYAQYVEYVPDDAEEAAQMALLMAEIAEKPDAANKKKWNAFNALEATLRRHPERQDVREKLVDYTIMVGRAGDAIDHIQALLKEKPDDIELKTKLGTCYYALDRNRECEETLREVIAKDPHQVEAYNVLAFLMRERLNRPAPADEMIDKMVEQNPEDAKARLNRAQYIARYYQPSEGNDVTVRQDQRKADLKKALELDPDDAVTLLLAAQAAMIDDRLEEARRYLEHGAKKNPTDERILIQLVRLDAQAKNFDAISDRLKAGPKSANLQQLDFEVKIQQHDLDGAKKILAALDGDKDTPQATKDYMRAYLEFAEGKWLPASKELERLRPAFPGLAAQIDMMLGHCYEQLREYDREVQAYERAVAGNPTSIPAHVGLARALMTLGQNERALGELLAVKRAQGVEEFVQSGPARSALLTLLLQRNSRLPQAEQDWSDVDEVLTATAKAFPDSKELLLVESTVREQKGDRAAAREMLQAAVKKDAKDPSAWLSLARIEFLEQGAEAALKLLDEAQESTGDTASLRQARVGYALQLPAAEAKTALDGIAKGLDKFTEEEQDRLHRLLGVAYFRNNELTQSRDMWSKAAQKHPNDPEVQFMLFDIAIREFDDTAIQSRIAEIEKLFGSGSPEAKFAKARRLVAQVRANKVADGHATLNEARQLVRRASEQRPRWAVLARFEGEVDMLDGRPDDAITHLEQAVEYGDSDVATARQIAQLLVSRGRGDEAKQYMQLANVKGAGSDNGASEMLEVGLALSENDLPKAVKLLESARERDPDDVQKIVTLGQLLPQLGRDDEAEVLLRGLVEKQPELPIGWFELVRFLKAHQRDEDARATIGEAQAKLPKEQVDLAVGQLNEILGDLPTAEKHFIAARDAKPNDLGLTRALATFYLRANDIPKAREQVDRLLAAQPSNDADREHLAWANREMAMLLANSGTYADFQAAMKRLRPSGSKTPPTLADKVTMARLLAARPEADSRREATKLLEDIKNESTLPADGQLILAKLYEATGNWPKCRDEMLSLLGKSKDNPGYIGTFIEMLIRNKDIDAAQFWLEKMQELAPDATLTAALTARVLVKQGKPEEAVAVLRNILPRPMPKERVGLLLEIAKLVEQLDQKEAAESMIREYVALEPREILVLAGFIGRNGSLKDALDMCQTALDTRKPEEVVRQALAVLRLRTADATKDDYARVEAWLTKAIARDPKALILQLEYAELLDLQGRYAELEEMYTKLLKGETVVSAQRALVLNNLAYLLAAQNKVGDSPKLIDEAINILGPQSDLLDTRALVRLANGQVKEAVDDLNLAVVDQPSGTKYFHLARACQMAKDNNGAQDAMRKAVENYSLKASDLPPLEQASFKQLCEQFGLK